jgi:aspartate aminotransferase-like enzyme
MTHAFYSGRFFLPGPTEVRTEVLEGQLHPMIGHRGKAMEELIARLQPMLRDLFRTSRPVYISSSSATGLMEAAIRNGVDRKVLCLVNGAFSERFYRIAESCGVETILLQVPWGQGHTPDMVADALASDPCDAVTVVHSETSTGALNPVEDLARVAHEAGAVLLVDSVTGVAGAPVLTDAWELDFVLTGSQKALALPPGLALGVAQENILRRAMSRPGRGTYFDLLEFEKYIQKNQTPNTPPVSLLYALLTQLERIQVETLEARWARHADMAARVVARVAGWRERGIEVDILAPEGFRSPTVTCLTVGGAHTGSAVNAAMKERGFTISAGYGKLKDATIRIGHMGDHTVEELDRVLDALEEVLAA